MSPHSRALGCSAEGRNQKCWGVFLHVLIQVPQHPVHTAARSATGRDEMKMGPPPPNLYEHIWGLFWDQGEEGRPHKRCPGILPWLPQPGPHRGPIVPGRFAWQVQACGAISQSGPPLPRQEGFPPPPCEKRLPVPSFPMKKRRSLRIA